MQNMLWIIRYLGWGPNLKMPSALSLVLVNGCWFVKLCIINLVKCTFLQNPSTDITEIPQFPQFFPGKNHPSLKFGHGPLSSFGRKVKKKQSENITPAINKYGWPKNTTDFSVPSKGIIHRLLQFNCHGLYGGPGLISFLLLS